MPVSAFLEPLLDALWRASWQASLLILLVMLAQMALRRRLSPGWRSGLWLLVVLRLSLPVTPSSHWSLFNLSPRLGARGPSTLDPTAATGAQSHRSAGAWHGVGSETPPIWSASVRPGQASSYLEETTPEPFDDAVVRALSETPWMQATDAASIPAMAGPRRPAADSARQWLPTLFWIWLSGIIVLGARIVCGAALLSRRIQSGTRVTDRRILDLLEQSGRMMGTRRVPSLVETSAVDSPALFGLLRPRLLLPPGLFPRLNDSELRHVFMHELAHLRRHDVLLNWIAALLQTLHWFNPIVWFAMARMRLDRELACDALVLARSNVIEGRAYGATLLKLVSGLTPVRPVAGLVGISEGNSPLKQRIQSIASYRKPRRSSAFAGAMVFLILAAVNLTDARANRDAEVADNERNESAPEQVEKPADPTAQLEPGQTPTPPPQALSAAGGEATVDNGVHTLPAPNPIATTNLVHVGAGRLAIQSKMDRLIFEEVEFDGLALPDVLNYLGRVSRQLDPDQDGINFLINPSVVSAANAVVDPKTGQVIQGPQAKRFDMNGVKIRITPALRNPRLGDVLEAVIRAADQPIRYSVEEYAIIFSRKPPDESAHLETRVFKVNPNRFIEGLYAVGTFPLGDAASQGLQGGAGGGGLGGGGGFGGGGGDGIGGGQGGDGLPVGIATNLTANVQQVVRDFFTAAGVNVFPPNQIYFSDRKGVLIVRATSAELDVIQQAIEVLNEPPPRIAIEANPDDRARERRSPRMQIDPWNVADMNEEQSQSELASDPNATQDRQSIESKLGSIVLDEISFDGVPLWKAVRQLEAESILQDPEGHGVRMYLDESLNALHFKNSVDPATGQPAAWFDLESIVIRILPPIRNVRLGDVLDAMVRVVDQPIQYAIVDQGIAFSRKPPEEVARLETRIYRVDPKRFEVSIRQIPTLPRPSVAEKERADGPASVTATSATQETGDFGARLREFLTAAGVNPWPPNQVYFSDRKGLLMVRATTQELDALHAALEVLGVEKPPINRVRLEVRAVELTRTESRELGFDWFLGNNIPVQPPSTADAHPRPVIDILTERQFSAVLDAMNQHLNASIQTVAVVTAPLGERVSSSWKTSDGTLLTLNCGAAILSDAAGLEILMLGLSLVAGSGETETDRPIEQDSTTTVRSSDDTIIPRVVWTGQTVVLRHPPNVEPQLGPETEASRKQLLVFVTATLLDSTTGGSAPRSFDPDTIPSQD